MPPNYLRDNSNNQSVQFHKEFERSDLNVMVYGRFKKTKKFESQFEFFKALTKNRPQYLVNF